jgi:hypothetical protein
MIRAIGGGIVGVLAIGTVATATGSATAAPEDRQLGNVVCTVTSTWTYSPGVVLSPRPTRITIEDRYSSCESITDPTLQYGHSTFTIERDASCLEALGVASDTQKITWNNGEESHFTFTNTVTSAPGADVVTKAGTISAGHFEGSSAQTTHVAPALNLRQCATDEGVGQSTVVGTFTIP